MVTLPWSLPFSWKRAQLSHIRQRLVLSNCTCKSYIPDWWSGTLSQRFIPRNLIKLILSLILYSVWSSDRLYSRCLHHNADKLVDGIRPAWILLNEKFGIRAVPDCLDISGALLFYSVDIFHLASPARLIGSTRRTATKTAVINHFLYVMLLCSCANYHRVSGQKTPFNRADTASRNAWNIWSRPDFGAALFFWYWGALYAVPYKVECWIHAVYWLFALDIRPGQHSGELPFCYAVSSAVFRLSLHLSFHLPCQ